MIKCSHQGLHAALFLDCVQSFNLNVSVCICVYRNLWDMSYTQSACHSQYACGALMAFVSAHVTHNNSDFGDSFLLPCQHNKRQKGPVWVWVVREKLKFYTIYLTELNINYLSVLARLQCRCSAAWLCFFFFVKVEWQPFQKLPGACTFWWKLSVRIWKRKSVSAPVSHLRWSPAAHCSWCSGKRSHSSEVWEGIQLTGWCGETGDCGIPLWEEEKDKKGTHFLNFGKYIPGSIFH